MHSILKGLTAIGLALATGGALAAEGEGSTPHYPLIAPVEQDWSFAGPFGTYDRGQLQRGLKVFLDGCSSCHGLSRVAFRSLEALGYSEAQVRALAGEMNGDTPRFPIVDGPDSNGEMFTRAAVPSDHFPSPYPNTAAAAASFNGAAPPDLSLIAKGRAVTRGFPTFVFDIFTQYAEGGPDYIYGLLTGYTDPPAGVEVEEGVNYYNPHFMSGAVLAMAPPLSDGAVTYDDDAPQTLDQYARDVSAFLMWAAEPHLEARKKTGFVVLLFLVLFAGLVYLTKRKIWTAVAH